MYPVPQPSAPPARGAAPAVSVGILAVIGFALPVLAGRELVFPSLLPFTSEGRMFTVEMILLLMYPLIAGIATIVAAAVARGRLRGGILVGLGLLTVVVNLTGANVLPQFSQMLAQGVSDSARTAALTVLLGFAGWSLLWAGAGVVAGREWDRLPKILAAVGGALFVLHLLLPILPSQAGATLLGFPFKLLTAEAVPPEAKGLGALILLSMVLNVIGSVVGFCLAGSRTGTGLAKGIRVLAVCGVVLLLLTPLYALLLAVGSSSETLAPALLAYVKFLCTGIGLFAVIPLGLADLLGAGTSPAAFAAGAGPAPYGPGYGAPYGAPPPHPGYPACPPQGYPGQAQPAPRAYPGYPPPAQPPQGPGAPYGWPSPPAGQPRGGQPQPAAPGTWPAPPAGACPPDPRLAEAYRLLMAGAITREEYERRWRECQARPYR